MNGIQEAKTLEDARLVKVFIGIERKKCHNCQKVKPINAFSPSKTTKDRIQHRCKKCQAKDKRKWQKLNPVKAGEWAKLNPEAARMINRRSKAKQRNTLKGKLEINISTAIRIALRGRKNGRSWESLVGYTVSQLKKHLEKQFTKGMTWENYGRNGWHIDHKIPISAFNFTKPEHRDFKRCWALKNLQPMWQRENIIKSNNLDKHFQPSLLL